MTENKLHIGILGCANIADRYVIPAIAGLDDCFKLSGIASRSQEKAGRFAAKFNARPYGSYAALLQDARLDAVYIPLPNALHYEWVDNALDAGLHVLVEKSLGCTYAEVEALVQKARRRNLLVMEHFQFRFHRQLALIKDIMHSGRLGELRCIRSSFGFPPFPDRGNIRYKKELGGGALLDAGAYPIKLSQQIMGYDISVAAAKYHVDPELQVDLWGGGFLNDNASGLFSEIAFGFDHHYQCSLELWGSRGRLYTNRIFTAPPDYRPVICIEDGNGTEQITSEDDHHFRNILRYFHGLIAGDRNFEVEYMENLNQARLIEEFRSKAHGK